MIHRAMETILIDNDCIGENSLPENLSQRYRIALFSGTNPDTPESPPEAVFLISDKNTLLAEGESRGIFSLQILNSENLTHMSAIPPERLVFHSLHTAADWILKHPNAREDLEKAIDKGALSLRQGKLTAFPTETVYGLGADALNRDAVKLIFKAKQRPFYDPLIVHISELQQLDTLVLEFPEKARRLAEAFWPGPLTLVLKKDSRVPDIVTAEHPTVAIRMPSNPWARELIHRAGTPVAAPSANLFGRTSPTTAAHVAEQLSGSYEVLIDAGACRVGLESTVLSLAGERPLLLRNGGVSREQIEEIIGPVEVPEKTRAGDAESPGMLPNHYAPLTPLLMVPDVRDYAENRDIGCILFEKPDIDFEGPTVQVSENRNADEIAVNIYAALRSLDGKGLRLIVCEWCPDSGIGAAVNDRLTKASAKPQG
ncbi:L-threonylcarbamoyladenylate synthase [Marispirochaeta aestuarii]|uniref:L-threonylcarbamoyladenylate synthase n=1 Tax=Marispirochaeta aestuarii TaxID=1963862 RepID=UPI0029C7248B|nr:L-threonylcarbamoyladenylate synthase [Marispirochaeta aestuarii]